MGVNSPNFFLVGNILIYSEDSVMENNVSSVWQILGTQTNIIGFVLTVVLVLMRFILVKLFCGRKRPSKIMAILVGISFYATIVSMLVAGNKQWDNPYVWVMVGPCAILLLYQVNRCFNHVFS